MPEQAPASALRAPADMAGPAVLPNAATVPQPPAAHAWGRTWLIWLAFLVSLQTRPIGPPFLMPVVLLVGTVVGVAAACGARSSRSTASRWASSAPAAATLVAVGLLLAGFELAWFAVNGRFALAAVLVACFTTLGILACGFIGSSRFVRVAFLLFLAVSTVLQLALLAHAPVPGDAGILGQDSIRALLHGHNPYAITIPNPYEPARTRLFFLPENLVGNRLDFGYAYLPVSMLGGIPGYLLGNVAYSYVAALLAVTVLLRRLAVDATGRALALVPLAMPFTPELLVNQWVEPVSMVCLGCCVWAWRTGRVTTTSGSLGLLLASKQYVAVAIPLLWLVGRSLGIRAVVGALALATLVVGAFVVLDPHAFAHSAVWLQFHLPLREDSVSIAAAWSRTFGTAPPVVLGPLAILAGLVVSGLIALRGAATATSFSLGVGLSLLITVVLSTHAFPNYYAMIEVALVMGCITWPADARTRSRHGVEAPRPVVAR